MAEILKNEKYIGDVYMQKTYVPDHISHKKVVNDKTVLPGYYVRDHHPGIVSRREYEIAQTIAAMRDRHSGATQYPYLGTLHCPCCGGRMVRLCLNGHGHQAAWACPNAECTPEAIREKYVDRALLQAFSDIDEDKLIKVNADAVNTAVAWKARLSELGSFFPRVEYAFLEATVQRITFDGWSTCVIKWKWGEESRIHIDYDRVSEIPDAEILYSDHKYFYNGVPIANGKHISFGLANTKRDILNMKNSGDKSAAAV